MHLPVYRYTCIQIQGFVFLGENQVQLEKLSLIDPGLAN